MAFFDAPSFHEGSGSVAGADAVEPAGELDGEGAVEQPTAMSKLARHLDDIDLALCMTVHPGFGGQAYIPESTERIRRLRAMIDAKLKGEGIDLSEPEEPERSNVIDLMAALKKSLGQAAEAKPDRKSTRLNSSHRSLSRMPSSA